MPLNELKKLLKSTQIIEIVPKPEKILAFDSDDLITKAIEKLSKKKVVSAPVFCKKGKQFIGLVDFLDILNYIVELFEESSSSSIISSTLSPKKHTKTTPKNTPPTTPPSSPNNSTTTTTTTSTTKPKNHHNHNNHNHNHNHNKRPTLHSSPSQKHQHHQLNTNLSFTLLERLKTANKFSQTILSEVTNFNHNPYTAVSPKTSIWDACVEQFVKKHSHRCPVEDENKKITSILTQSAVLRFITINKNKIGKKLLNKKIGDMKIGTSPVLTVGTDVKTITAFKKMHNSKVSGIGVVDKAGRLIGNLSARDLNELNCDNLYKSLYQTAHNFVKLIRQKEINESHPAISCTPETTLSFVLSKLSANRIHRVYICNKNFLPIGVISLRDIISYIVNFIEKEEKKEL